MMGFFLGVVATVFATFLVRCVKGPLWFSSLLDRVMSRIDPKERAALSGHVALGIPIPVRGTIEAGCDSELRCSDLVCVVPVSDRRVQFGCHGRYSLHHARLLAAHYGGDPECGGGFKDALWVSRRTQWWTWLKMAWLFRTRTSFSGFIEGNGTQSSSTRRFFIGAERDIREFLKLPEGVQILPASLRIV